MLVELTYLYLCSYENEKRNGGNAYSVILGPGFSLTKGKFYAKTTFFEGKSNLLGPNFNSGTQMLTS